MLALTLSRSTTRYGNFCTLFKGYAAPITETEAVFHAEQDGSTVVELHSTTEISANLLCENLHYFVKQAVSASLVYI